MSKYEINIPKIEIKKDLTIIYKGRKEREGHIFESIEEYQTSKEEFLRKLRYFKRKSTEINQMNEIFIHDEYSHSIFKTFINSIESDKIEINDDNYDSINSLSQKYEYLELTNELSKFKKTRPDIVEIINQKDQNRFNSEQEEKLSKHLDICLMNEKFINFPIQTLSRILNSPNRVLNNHHLLFEFVKKLIKKSDMEKQQKNIKLDEEQNHENLQVLLSCLDLNEMSNDELDEYFNDDHFSSIFESRHSKERMKSIHNENKKNQKKICEIENRLLNIEEEMKIKNQLREESDCKMKINFNDLLNKINKQEMTVVKYKKENDELQQSIKKQEKKIEQLELNLKNYEEMKRKFDEQNQTIWKNVNEIKKLCEIVNKLEEKIEKTDKRFDLKGSIRAKVESDQSIKGRIQIDGNENYFDKKNSKFILNTNNSQIISEKEYQNAELITSMNQDFLFRKNRGTYFLHVKIYNKFGDLYELVSDALTTKGVQHSFDFTGRVQSVKLGSGTYKLEVWGAEGGENQEQYSNGSYTGNSGKGGYSVGTLKLNTPTTLYVYVGEKPNSKNGGWNGGGSTKSPGAGGGGSTDISLYGEEDSTSWNTSNHLYSRIIVAGAGGGSSFSGNPNEYGGCGGGLNGQNCGNNYASGGTQSDGYQFGIGESNSNIFNSGGGSGWYGGRSCIQCVWGPGGGGGSGFVYNSSTASSYPSGCKLNSLFYLTNSTTISGNEQIPKTTGIGTENGHSGNGYAKITPQ